MKKVKKVANTVSDGCERQEMLWQMQQVNSRKPKETPGPGTYQLPGTLQSSSKSTFAKDPRIFEKMTNNEKMLKSHY